MRDYLENHPWYDEETIFYNYENRKNRFTFSVWESPYDIILDYLRLLIAEILISHYDDLAVIFADKLKYLLE